jgi:hypothetical protein
VCERYRGVAGTAMVLGVEDVLHVDVGDVHSLGLLPVMARISECLIMCACACAVVRWCGGACAYLSTTFLT